MHRLRLSLCIVSLTACASAGSGSRPAEMPRGELPMTYALRGTSDAILPVDLLSRLYAFADDSMLGRESGTRGNVLATSYVAAEMARMGLLPGGEDGGWFQTVPVILASVDSASTFDVDAARLALWREIAPQIAGTGGRGFDGPLPAVYGGRIGGAVITPAQAAGKLVVFLPALPVPGPLTGAPAPAPYSGDVTTARAQALSIQPIVRAAAGVAYVILDGFTPAALDRLRQPRAELAPSERALAPAGVPALYLGAAAARQLFGGTSLDSLAAGAPGRTLRAHLAVRTVNAPFPSRNVIGVLPGSDPALRGQYVAIGAHNDHIGSLARPLDHDSVLANNMVVRRQGAQDPVRAPTTTEAARIAQLRDSLVRAHGGARRDSVFNGADDDGSGTVAMLEIAERFATQPSRPRRSLLFVSHTGEEKGLWGSQWFTDHPTVPRDSIVAQLNMDMVGRGKAGDVMGRGPNNVQLIGPRRLSTQLGDVIDSLNATRAVPMDIDRSFDANGHPLNRYCRSDHYMYARYGIPITYFSLGYHTDYHQVTDEPQYIDYEHMARIAQFVHDIAEAVANRSQRLVVDKPKPDPAGGCRQ